MQHGEGLQARLLARLACMQAAVNTGQPSYMALNAGPFEAAGTVMTLGILSELLRVRLPTSVCVVPGEAHRVNEILPSSRKKAKGQALLSTMT